MEGYRGEEREKGGGGVGGEDEKEGLQGIAHTRRRHSPQRLLRMQGIAHTRRRHSPQRLLRMQE